MRLSRIFRWIQLKQVSKILPAMTKESFPNGSRNNLKQEQKKVSWGYKEFPLRTVISSILLLPYAFSTLYHLDLGQDFRRCTILGK